MDNKLPSIQNLDAFIKEMFAGAKSKKQRKMAEKILSEYKSLISFFNTKTIQNPGPAYESLVYDEEDHPMFGDSYD